MPSVSLQPTTIGWSISQWKEFNASSDSTTILNTLITLVQHFSKDDPAWISIATSDNIHSQWELIQSLPNASSLPLYGVPIAVKDNIDALGFHTTAACPAFKYDPKQDATIVSLLRKAGAIVVGKTNLDQFATGLVGTRSPYGKPSSVFSNKHVSGGSSSGSGSVVGRGLVPLALGTDTAGSGRVPAAINNIIGLKPTRGVFSCKGVVPACRSLDCPSLLTLNLQDAQLVFSIVAQFDQADGYSRHLPDRLLTKFSKSPVFAVPDHPVFFDDEYNPEIYQNALDKLKSVGVRIVKKDFSILYKLANLLYEGPWVGERYSAIRDFVTTRKTEMDPVVYSIVKKAENFSAADCFDYEYARKDILRQISKEFDEFDGLVVPTCPLNPTFEDLEKEPVLVNSRQGTYTNFVNLADMSALAIPAGFRLDGLSNGITLISKKFNDYALLELAQRFLTASPRMIGNLDIEAGKSDILHPSIPQTAPVSIPLVVVGGHLSGMALNWQLQKVNATLAQKTTTSPNYRLYALPNTTPAKPGLRRVSTDEKNLDGEKIIVEVWNVPADNFGTFISMVPHPLGIGNVELADGRWIKGFICEESGYKDAEDITKYGGWRAYMATKAKPTDKPFDTVLVANHGEIAVRIIRTLKRLGIRSIAVFSEPDRYTQHVLDADESVSLDGTTAGETYLDIEKIIKAAKDTGAQGIIPGYGFLSENADFAEACENNGIIFIGPSAESIRALGLKHSARAIAERAGVPMVPGSGLLDTVEEAIAVAERIKYPVMIKSTAGGGGIGLQCVRDPKDLPKAFETVKHQGLSYFNNSGVFIERNIENARHVEVQVFGDGRGGAIALGERDCSLQRRHQKIVEETPAPRLSNATREKMREAAQSLVSTMKYKCAGTVEYIYDEKNEEFFFLEVNARLQVEHTITEEVTGLDLVEWMLYIAADRPPAFDRVDPKGASIEVRIYAENPVKDFLPSPGQITDVHFPKDARVDTWVVKGSTISPEYDPTIAKMIVYGKDRADAIQKMSKALDETVIYGPVTNIDYLRSIINSEMFKEAKVATKVLDSYTYTPLALEITAPGSYTTVQDYPGRTNYWRIGVPPSGPMDAYAFRVANRIVGNHSKAPAIECTLTGPSMTFHCDTVIALTGGKSPATLDGKPIDFWKYVPVKAGQKLVVGKLSSGCRSYIAIRGGIDVPEYLGSRSTFALGTMGGFNGRVLKFGDVLFLGNPQVSSCTLPAPISEPIEKVPSSLVPAVLTEASTGSTTWNVGVTVGPHGAPDFFKPEYIQEFFESKWKVHYNSNRFGVRLVGPKPKWARKDGGEGGLHPSNAHDYVYSLGAINFTGDEPVILTCDGPSLGGFVCAAVIVEAEMWKIGQVKPGDLIQFVPITYDEAIELKEWQDKAIDGAGADGFTDLKPLEIVDKAATRGDEIAKSDPVLYKAEATADTPKIVYRQAGDRYILAEYGENIMDLNLAYRVFKLTEIVEKHKTVGVVEMSPGVRSVLIEFSGKKTTQEQLIKALVEYEAGIKTSDDWTVPSNIVRLPMAFEDSKTLNAVQRYSETIRSSAPWLPNNVDFIKNVNGMNDRNEVRDILYSARFLVLGLGDVFLGAPCAVPLDPRHRLLGSKYNPSRTFTPNGTVGIGGMYMCIYTMESPGGYQLVGRTIPIWDKLTLGQLDRPWLLGKFDVVEYFPVSEEELNKYTELVENGQYKIDIEESTFDHGAYVKWLEDNKASISEFTERQLEDTEEFTRLIQVSNAELEASKGSAVEEEDSTQYSENAEMVYAEVTGRFWKNMAVVGDKVEEGQGLVIVEAMKTEMVVPATVSGMVVKIVHKNGDIVEAGDLVAVIEP